MVVALAYALQVECDGDLIGCEVSKCSKSYLGLLVHVSFMPLLWQKTYPPRDAGLSCAGQLNSRRSNSLRLDHIDRQQCPPMCESRFLCRGWHRRLQNNLLTRREGIVAWLVPEGSDRQRIDTHGLSYVLQRVEGDSSRLLRRELEGLADP